MSIHYRIKPDFARTLEAIHHAEEGEPYRRPFFVALMLAHVASIPGITQDAILAATHYMRGIFTPDLRSDPRTALALREAEACEGTPGDGHAYRARLLREVVVALPQGVNLEAQNAALPTLSDTVLMIAVWALLLVAEDFIDTPECFCQDNQAHHPDRLYFELVDPDVCEPHAPHGRKTFGPCDARVKDYACARDTYWCAQAAGWGCAAEQAKQDMLRIWPGAQIENNPHLDLIGDHRG